MILITSSDVVVDIKKTEMYLFKENVLQKRVQVLQRNLLICLLFLFLSSLKQSRNRCRI